MTKTETADDFMIEKDGGAQGISMEELQAGNIVEMAKDKFTSRMLQRSLGKTSGGVIGDEISRLIYAKAEPHFMELVRDQYGNYLSQKILEVCSPEQFDLLFAKIKPELTDLAQDLHGTRAVQKVVEQAVSRSRVSELLSAFPAGLQEKLARSVTGFHVVVKMLETLPTKEAEDLLGELCGTPQAAQNLGCDQWGCCVLKKCIDRAEGEMKKKILDSVVGTVLNLVQDPYGNYVVQHVIQMRTNVYVSRIVDAVSGRVFEFAFQKFSSNVLEKCLVNAGEKDRAKVLHELLNPPHTDPSEAVRALLFNQYGNYVLQQALEVAKGPQNTMLIDHVKPYIQDLVRNIPVEEPVGGNLASEHVRRIAMKLVKKYPALSEGLEEPPAPGLWDPFDAAGMPWAPPMMNPYTMAGMADPYAAMAAAYGGQPPFPMPFGYPGYPGYPPMPYPSPYAQPVAGQSAKAGQKKPGAPNDRAAGAKGGKGKKKGAEGGGDATKKMAKKTPKSAGVPGGPPPGVPPSAYPAHIPMPVSLSPPPNLSPMGPSPGMTTSTTGSNGEIRVGRIVGFWPNYSVTYDDVPATGGTSGTGGGGGRKKGKAKAPGAPAPGL